MLLKALRRLETASHAEITESPRDGNAIGVTME
jgi:hypothetical protein